LSSSEEHSSGNGNGAAHVGHSARITLDFDMCTGALRMDARVPSLDAALNILHQAMRHFEIEFRQAKALEFAARAQRAAQDEQVRAMLTRGKG
jgi:hypothetical protein